MRKLLCFAIICLLLLSFASAESVSAICTKWNSLGSHYSSVQLSEDIATEKDGMIYFTGDSWKVIFADDQVGIYAEDFQTLMCNAATAGLMAVGDASGFREYLGNIAYQYLAVISGETPLMLMYGSYTFNIAPVDKGYMLLLKK